MSNTIAKRYGLIWVLLVVSGCVSTQGQFSSSTGLPHESQQFRAPKNFKSVFAEEPVAAARSSILPHDEKEGPSGSVSVDGDESARHIQQTSYIEENSVPGLLDPPGDASETVSSISADELGLEHEVEQLCSATESVKSVAIEADDALTTLKNVKEEFVERNERALAKFSSQVRRSETIASQDESISRALDGHGSWHSSATHTARSTRPQSQSAETAASELPHQLLETGKTLYRAGNYRGAEEAFRKLDLQSFEARDRLPIQYMIANCLRKQGRLQESATVYRDITSSDVDDILVQLAQWQLEAIDWRQNTHSTR